ncbi:MAG TPA: lysophospholipid acyltransferase family protein [Pseudomonadales bacterium]|nr:lysophospholipid acyltransferase family protein [Pseudomonadales bacterium]
MRVRSRPSPKRQAIARQILMLLGKLPINVAQRLGAILGWCLWLFPTRAKKTTAININKCFPDKPEAWRNNLIKNSLIQTGVTAGETAPMWLQPGDTSLALVKQVEGWDLFEAALKSGKGVVLIGGHFGSWELSLYWITKRVYLTGMYQPPKYESIDDIIYKARGQFNCNLVPTNSVGVKAYMEAIRKKEVMYVLPDQEPGVKSGEFVPFFGVPALSNSLIPRLVRGVDIPVLTFSCIRLGVGKGFKIKFTPADPNIHDKDPLVGIRALNKTLEDTIMMAPEQYQWSYKRFKRRPPGEVKFY